MTIDTLSSLQYARQDWTLASARAVIAAPPGAHPRETVLGAAEHLMTHGDALDWRDLQLPRAGALSQDEDGPSTAELVMAVLAARPAMALLFDFIGVSIIFGLFCAAWIAFAVFGG